MGIEGIEELKPFADDNTCVLCGNDRDVDGYCVRTRCLYSKDSIQTNVTAS